MAFRDPSPLPRRVHLFGPLAGAHLLAVGHENLSSGSGRGSRKRRYASCRRMFRDSTRRVPLFPSRFVVSSPHCRASSRGSRPARPSSAHRGDAYTLARTFSEVWSPGRRMAVSPPGVRRGLRRLDLTADACSSSSIFLSSRPDPAPRGEGGARAAARDRVVPVVSRVARILHGLLASLSEDLRGRMVTHSPTSCSS